MRSAGRMETKEKVLLQHVTLSVRPGAMVAVIGKQRDHVMSVHIEAVFKCRFKRHPCFTTGLISDASLS